MSEQAEVAPAAAGAPDPGARLRLEREQRGLALGAVADALHVAPRLVVAMEANEFSAFDAPVYAKGFLRKYAGFLGIPAEEVLGAYDALAAGPSQPTLIPAMNVAPPKPGLAALPLAPALIGVALLLAAGASWWWFGRGPARVAAPVANAPAAETRAADRDGGAGTAVPTQQPELADPTASAAPAPAAAPPAEPHARPAEAVPAPAAAPAAHHAATAARADALVLHGVRECWAEVYAADGQRLLYDLVRPGETRPVAGPGPWKVFLGYADGARLTVGDHVVIVPPARRAAATARFVVARDGVVQ
jgi:cytoskeleton protein RodZ